MLFASKGMVNTVASSSGAQPEKFPAGQAVGLSVPAADCAQKEPAGQGRGWGEPRAPSSVVPVLLQNVPLGQPVQATAEALL